MPNRYVYRGRGVIEVYGLYLIISLRFGLWFTKVSPDLGAFVDDAEMRAVGPLIRFVRHGQMLDDAPWEWGSTGGWCADMPEFFQGMPSGVYDNIWEDLDDSPVTWHITEVASPLTVSTPLTCVAIICV